PHEAAAANHYSPAKRLLGFGMLGMVFLPLLLFVPLKLIGAWQANRRMDAFFSDQAIRLKPVLPGNQSEGFVFTPLDAGSKVMRVRILRMEGPLEFVFNIPVAGIDADYQNRDFSGFNSTRQLVECDLP